MGMFFPSDDEKPLPGRRKGFNRCKQLFLMDLLQAVPAAELEGLFWVF